MDCEGISAEGRTLLHGLGRTGWNHNQIFRAKLLKVEKAEVAFREVCEELIIVSERVTELQLEFSGDKWKWMHTGKTNPDSK